MNSQLTWIPNTTEIKKIVTILKDLLVQVWITFLSTDQGVRIYAIDPSKTAIVLYESRDNYEFQSTNEKVFCCFTSQLYHVIMRAKTTSQICVTSTNVDDILKIHYDDYRFSLRSMAGSAPSFSIPECNYTIEFLREVKDLYHTLHAISGISTTARLSLLNNTVTWKTDQDESGISLSVEEVEPGMNAHFTGVLLLKYAEKVLKANTSKTVLVRIDPQKKAICFQFSKCFQLIMVLQ
jgi:hypothetical protein